MFARINGIKLSYVDQGPREAPALLLVHGYPLDARMWDAQVAGLSDVARVIAPDLRGLGQSDAPAGPYSMDQYAGDVRGLLDHLGVRRAVVSGLSMGGYVAFAFWRHYPERVRAMALVDTRAGADSVEGKANRDAAIRRAREGGAEAIAEDLLPRMIAPDNQNDLDLVSRLRTMLIEQRVAGIIGALQALRDRPDSTSELPGIIVPVEVIVGDADVISPPSEAQVMAEALPSARLDVIPRAGHMSPMENPVAVNKALRDFLAVLPRT